MSQLYMTRGFSASLTDLIQREVAALRNFPETDAAVRPNGPGSWSPKEELGHLIDSAANNHLRFARAAIEPEYRGDGYAQDDWVRIHNYQEMHWSKIVDFWFHYNSFIASLLSHIPDNKLETLCFIGASQGVSLRFLVEDYMLHMRHHIDHLLGREHVTAYR